MQKVRLKSCIRHCCPQHSCFLFLTHTPEALRGMMTHTPTPDDHNYFVHAPTLPGARFIHVNSRRQEPCTRGQAERRAQSGRATPFPPTQVSAFSSPREPAAASMALIKKKKTTLRLYLYQGHPRMSDWLHALVIKCNLCRRSRISQTDPWMRYPALRRLRPCALRQS